MYRNFKFYSKTYLHHNYQIKTCLCLRANEQYFLFTFSVLIKAIFWFKKCYLVFNMFVTSKNETTNSPQNLKPPYPTTLYSSIKLLILLPFRADLLCTLQYETTCTSVFFLGLKPLLQNMNSLQGKGCHVHKQL
jgi:hypothetical protein